MNIETKRLERKNSKNLEKIKELMKSGKHQEAKLLAQELVRDRQQVKAYQSLIGNVQSMKSQIQASSVNS